MGDNQKNSHIENPVTRVWQTGKQRTEYPGLYGANTKCPQRGSKFLVEVDAIAVIDKWNWFCFNSIYLFINLD